MNGPDKHHMELMDMDDGGHVMCFGCKATGPGTQWRPAGVCPTPWLTREQLLGVLDVVTNDLEVRAVANRLLTEERANLETELKVTKQALESLKGQQRDGLAVGELAKALDRVYQLEHAIFHALDDSGDTEDPQTMVITRLDFDKLNALLPEDWEHREETLAAQRLETLDPATVVSHEDMLARFAGKSITLDRAVAERIATTIEHGALFRPDDLEDLRAALADPAPHAGGEPIPAHFKAACDKFEWTPEEALRFYAEGKHFDVANGRTRILCTGAIASHALKGIAGEYADMKGVELAGGESVVYALSCYNDVGGYAPKMAPRETLPEPETREGYVAEEDHRAHVTRLQAELVEETKWRGSAEGGWREATRVITMQREKLDALQAELTKARELLRVSLDLPFSIAHQRHIELFLSNQSAPDDKGQGSKAERVAQLNAEIVELLAQDADHEKDA